MQRCKCGGAAFKSAKAGLKLGVGLEIGVGKHSEFQVSGLSRREPGAGTQVRVQVQDPSFARYPHLYLITRTRDLRAETWDPKMRSTFAPFLPRPLIPLGRHAVPTLPTASLVPSGPRDLQPSPLPRYSILDTPYSGIWNFVFPLPFPLGRVKPCRPRNS